MMSRRLKVAWVMAAVVSLGGVTASSWADEGAVPHGQNRPPGEPLSAAEAVRKMKVPKGFSVEVFASEPDIVNPVAMAFDERGRVWITESLEYPRREAGPGRDRVKILEDTDGDGRADKFTVFAEGLNIPSGIAIGHGGVWVVNSPDLLFLRDTDGDGKADQREVVLTGFGRDDTHELPNSLSWGPDGWLYGWNGVFNPSHVNYRGKVYDFTCAIFRIHPKTREFELFCEGTSNPWGITWDREGSAFASACVIDHLWHLTETGYYHRQGGPYPPFTWKIESIVGHGHQQAAYCGIEYYDSATYPAEYRGKLFMGNIHGNGINQDSLKRSGSTYIGTSQADFLTANDAWFMPVAQKTGPDGNLYVLDWYDRYHCYQDANRDPKGIDRLKGRLYRVRYGDSPRRTGFDLAKKSDDELIDLLGSENGFDRATARRLLAERDSLACNARLESIALNQKADRAYRMNALWALISRAAPGPDFLLGLLSDGDPGFRSWGVRAAGNQRRVAPAVRDKVMSLAGDPSLDVKLQVAIAARKVEGIEPVGLLTEVASNCGEDSLIPKIVWQNLHPLLESGGGRFMEAIARLGKRPSVGLTAIIPRAFERMISVREPDGKVVAGLLKRLVDEKNADAIREALDAIVERVREKSFSEKASESLRGELWSVLGGAEGMTEEDRLVFAYWHDPVAIELAGEFFLGQENAEPLRLKGLEALVFAAKTVDVLSATRKVLTVPELNGSVAFRGEILDALGTVESGDVAGVVLGAYPEMEGNLKPRAIELLTQRGVWSLELMKRIDAKEISPSALNVNQIRRLLSSKDEAISGRAKTHWRAVREGRNSGREQVIARVRGLLQETPGNPVAGALVFKNLCAQCHKIYGEGQEVGPEITANGRGSYEQLLSNVFDPNLVIGSAFQGTMVATNDGRVLTGLLVEKSAERVVLRLQGGKLEMIPASQVEEVKLSPLSLMPEDLEKQLKPQELADLFAFITLDKPPGDRRGKPIPGAEEIKRVVKKR